MHLDLLERSKVLFHTGITVCCGRQMLFPGGEASISLTCWLKQLVLCTKIRSYSKTDYFAHWQDQEYSFEHADLMWYT